MASQLLVSIQDLTRLGIPKHSVIGQLEPDELTAVLRASSGEALGYLGRYTMPLVEWGDDLRMHVCSIAAWRVLSVRGFNPEGGDKVVQINYDYALAWLKKVSMKTINPPDIVDSGTPAAPGEPVGSSPAAVSNESRGWNTRGSSHGGGPFTGR